VRAVDAHTSDVSAFSLVSAATLAPALVFVAVVIPIFALARLEWPADDDFVHWNIAREVSLPFGFATRMYAAWSGRFLTHMLNGFFFSQPDLYPLLKFVPPLAFVLLPLALLAGLEAFGVTIGRAQRWLIGSCALAALFLGLWPYLGDCVFWLTGGLGYAVPLVLGVLWLGSFVRRASAAMVTGTPVALFNEQVSVALIASAAAYLLLRRRVTRLQAAAMALLLAGCMVLFAAPGNAARAAAGPRGLSLSPFTLVANYVELMAATATRFISPAVVGLTLGLALALLAQGSLENRRRVAQFSVVMFAAAVAATLPLATVPDFAAPRTAFVPGTFLLAGCASLVFVLLPNRSGAVGLSLATCLVAVYVGLSTLDCSRARDLQAQLSARWYALQSGSGAEVVVAPLVGDRPVAIYFSDPSLDPAGGPNGAIAQFFGLRAVRTARS
jgi:hypothetical protein